MAAMSY